MVSSGEIGKKRNLRTRKEISMETDKTKRQRFEISTGNSPVNQDKANEIIKASLLAPNAKNYIEIAKTEMLEKFRNRGQGAQEAATLIDNTLVDSKLLDNSNLADMIDKGQGNNSQQGESADSAKITAALNRLTKGTINSEMVRDVLYRMKYYGRKQEIDEGLNQYETKLDAYKQEFDQLEGDYRVYHTNMNLAEASAVEDIQDLAALRQDYAIKSRIQDRLAEGVYFGAVEMDETTRGRALTSIGQLEATADSHAAQIIQEGQRLANKQPDSRQETFEDDKIGRTANLKNKQNELKQQFSGFKEREFELQKLAGILNKQGELEVLQERIAGIQTKQKDYTSRDPDNISDEDWAQQDHRHERGYLSEHEVLEDIHKQERKQKDRQDAKKFQEMRKERLQNPSRFSKVHEERESTEKANQDRIELIDDIMANNSKEEYKNDGESGHEGDVEEDIR